MIFALRLRRACMSFKNAITQLAAFVLRFVCSETGLTLAVSIKGCASLWPFWEPLLLAAFVRLMCPSQSNFWPWTEDRVAQRWRDRDRWMDKETGVGWRSCANGPSAFCNYEQCQETREEEVDRVVGQQARKNSTQIKCLRPVNQSEKVD